MLSAPPPDTASAIPPDALEAGPETPGGGGSWLLGFGLGLATLLVGTIIALGIGLFFLAAPPRAVLLLGVDERADEQLRGQAGHTDTIAALVLAPAGAATLVSFPRDLWVQIPGYGPERLNVAYPLGAQEGGPAGGARLLERTIGAETGLVIDRWAMVDFRGFSAVVDALGGVDVTVPHTLVDDEYPTEDYGTRRLVIPAGAQHFDGAEALAYVRTRAPDSDFGRMARQQQVLATLRQQALAPASWPRLPAALGALRAATTTNLSLREIAGLVRVLVTLPQNGLRTLVIGPELASPTVGPGGAAILRAPPGALRAALAEALGAR